MACEHAGKEKDAKCLLRVRAVLMELEHVWGTSTITDMR